MRDPLDNTHGNASPNLALNGWVAVEFGVIVDEGKVLPLIFGVLGVLGANNDGEH